MTKKKFKKLMLSAFCVGTNKLETNFRNNSFQRDRNCRSRLGVIVRLLTEATLGLQDVYFASVCFKNNFAMPKRLKKDEPWG